MYSYQTLGDLTADHKKKAMRPYRWEMTVIVLGRVRPPPSLCDELFVGIDCNCFGESASALTPL